MTLKLVGFCLVAVIAAGCVQTSTIGSQALAALVTDPLKLNLDRRLPTRAVLETYKGGFTKTESHGQYEGGEVTFVRYAKAGFSLGGFASRDELTTFTISSPEFPLRDGSRVGDSDQVVERLAANNNYAKSAANVNRRPGEIDFSYQNAALTFVITDHQIVEIRWFVTYL